jgi:ABC-2 type transport system ATP-binding protein
MQAIATDKLVVRRGERLVLAGISLQVAPGEVFALLGGNGAGKSTTLLTLLGFLQPESGTVRILGEAVAADPQAARQHIAYLPESASLYNHLDAYENLHYFLALSGREHSQAALDAALDRVALQPEARTRRLQDYSKGMRQKTAIALALLRQAPVLLLDEPTSGLDPVAIEEFNRLVKELAASGCAVMLVTHDLYGACQVADRIALLRDGHLKGEFHATPGERINLDRVLRSFNGLGTVA